MVILNDPGSAGKRNLNYAFPPFALGLPSVFERAGFDVNRDGRSRSGSRSSSRTASLNSVTSSMRNSSFGSNASLNFPVKGSPSQSGSRSDSITSGRLNSGSPRTPSSNHADQMFRSPQGRKSLPNSNSDTRMPTPTISVEDLSVGQTPQKHDRADSREFKFPMPAEEAPREVDGYSDGPVSMPTPDTGYPEFDSREDEFESSEDAERYGEPADQPQTEEGATRAEMPERFVPNFDDPSSHARHGSFKFDDDFDRDNLDEDADDATMEPEIKPRYISNDETRLPSNPHSEHYHNDHEQSEQHELSNNMDEPPQAEHARSHSELGTHRDDSPRRSGLYDDHQEDEQMKFPPQELADNNEGLNMQEEESRDSSSETLPPLQKPVASLPGFESQAPFRFQGITFDEPEDDNEHHDHDQPEPNAASASIDQNYARDIAESPTNSYPGPNPNYPTQGQSLQGPVSQRPPMPGPPMQGMPMQGMPMQGMTAPGAPMHGVPMKGMPTPMPGVPMPGMPMTGMPMPGMPMPMPGRQSPGPVRSPQQQFFGSPNTRQGHSPQMPQQPGPFRGNQPPAKHPGTENPDLFMSARKRFPKQGSSSPTVSQGDFSPSASPSSFNNPGMPMRPGNPRAQRMAPGPLPHGAPPPAAFPPPRMGGFPNGMPPQGFNGRPPIPPHMMGTQGPPNGRPVGPMGPMGPMPPMGMGPMGPMSPMSPMSPMGPTGPMGPMRPMGAPIMRPAGPVQQLNPVPRDTTNDEPFTPAGQTEPIPDAEYQSHNLNRDADNHALPDGTDSRFDSSFQQSTNTNSLASDEDANKFINGTADTTPVDVTLPSPMSIAKRAAPKDGNGLLAVHNRHGSNTSSIYSSRNTEAPSFYGAPPTSRLGDVSSNGAASRESHVDPASIEGEPGHSSEPSQASSVSFSFDQAPLSTSPPTRADTWYSAQEGLSIREKTPAEPGSDERAESADGPTPTMTQTGFTTEDATPTMPQTELVTDSPAPRKTAKPGRKQCRGCTLPISGKSVRALDGTLSGRWHRECFNCTRCNVSLAGVEKIHVLEDQPYCSRCYHTVNHSICQKCGEGIEGSCLETRLSSDGGQPFLYHTSCLRCDDCHIKLQHSYFDVGGATYCAEHAFTSLPADTSVHKRYTQFMMI